MTEWKLFQGENPWNSSLQFFENNPWVPPEHQLGHAERTAMAAELISQVVHAYSPATLSDLGCGDGSLLEKVQHLPVQSWGYDAGAHNVRIAEAKGLHVTQRDIFSSDLSYGELITCCEVVEHLEKPHEFVRNLPGYLLIVTSPSAETGEWYYEDHTWAWDLEGYRTLVESAGWRAVRQVECNGGVNHHFGITRPQRFQGIFAVREPK